MNKKVNKKSTFLVRLDIGWKEILDIHKKKTGRSFKDLIEELLSEHLTVFIVEEP